MSVAVVLAESAAEALDAIESRADAVAVARRLRALRTFPEIGSVYDPEYQAARPDHQVLVTYAGHFGIYYVYDPALRDGTVYVEWIQDERRNPMTRFSLGLPANS